jgi:hypothetical protein
MNNCIDCGEAATKVITYKSGPESVCDGCDNARKIVMAAFPNIYGTQRD